MSRKRICVIAFRPVRSTIHVLRQIDYLTPHYDLTVIGNEATDPTWPFLTWLAVPEAASNVKSKILKLARLVAGRVVPSRYEGWFWALPGHRLAYELAVASGADAYHANDWDALPVAIAAARQTGAKVVVHLHEYAEEDRKLGIWRLLVAPAIRYFIRTAVSDPDVPIAASITVCEPIAERYRREFGLNPIVVHNAARPLALPPVQDAPNSARIRLIHHGFAKRRRGLHHLIEALALTDSRYTLDFMLVADSPGYLAELKRLADKLTPGRVQFREPVAPAEIIRQVAPYDLGLCVIEPTSYNNLMMLPNKLFEYIQAGLAVCVGPSPAMAGLVRQYGPGLVTTSFDPPDVAAALNRLTAEDLVTMKAAARRAAAVLNADVEMAKIVDLYREILGDAEADVLPTRKGVASWVS
ncbi:MAG TPA: glycosyltransferase [Chloroflexota bacterium]|nr:glycosyltransferase [Chloroflexota bacterium]